MSLIVVGPKEYEYGNPEPGTVILDFPGWESNRSGEIPAESAIVQSIRAESLRKDDGTPLARLEVRLTSGVSHRVYALRGEVHLVLERAHPDGVADRADATVAAAPIPSSPAPAPGGREEEPVRSVRAATSVLQVTHQGAEGEVVIGVVADGPLRYETLVLANPHRLVVDLPGVVNRVPVQVLSVDRGPVQRVRVAQFSVRPRTVTRVVVDLISPAAYRIVSSPDGLSVFVSLAAPTNP